MLLLVVEQSVAAGVSQGATSSSDLETLCWWITLGLLILGVALIAAAVLVARGSEEFIFRRHWGGFGGGSTGWRMSRPLMSLISGLLLIVMGTALAFGMFFESNRSLPNSTLPNTIAQSPGTGSGTPQTGTAPATVLPTAAVNTGALPAVN
jgi:uncharacterized membrane protein